MLSFELFNTILNLFCGKIITRARGKRISTHFTFSPISTTIRPYYRNYRPLQVIEKTTDERFFNITTLSSYNFDSKFQLDRKEHYQF